MIHVSVELRSQMDLNLGITSIGTQCMAIIYAMAGSGVNAALAP